MNTIYKKNFWKSLLYRQNNHHNHGVFWHTFWVTYYLIKNKHYKMIAAGILHDIGKPLVAKADAKDIAKGEGELSFTNHEEISYLMIKDWKFLSAYSKQIVRHHYLVRSMSKAKEKGETLKHRRLQRRWDGLSKDVQIDLVDFFKCDDLGKK